MSYQVCESHHEEQSNTVSEQCKDSLSSAQIDEIILEHRENGRKLARSMLRRWRAHMNIEEIDSIVDLTLCEAAQRFDPTNGASFMTFYFYHLRGYLVRAVATAVNSSNVMLAFEADAAEKAADGTDFFTSAIDYFESGRRDADGPESRFLKKESARVCNEACEQLDELEREVILRSFKGEEALVDIAKSLGYSRCHISRVKKRALERLQEIITLNEAGIRVENTQEESSELSCSEERPKKRTRRRRSRRRRIETSEAPAVETVHKRRA